MKFADRLKAWRRATERSQSQAAAFLGVRVRTLQEWEQERFEPIHGETLLRLMNLDPLYQARIDERKAKRKKRA